MSGLAVFDLDNTLLAGDSDYLWGQYLVDHGIVDREHYEAANRRFYEEYVDGTLNIFEFAEFSLEPLARLQKAGLAALREAFVADLIRHRVAPLAPALLARHRAAGDTLLITTATNRFITEPIAQLLGVDDLIATDPEIVDGRYTGRLTGVPNFREGKVERLQQWRAAQPRDYAYLTCYSDSHNDLPLLRAGTRAIAVDPDARLREEALRSGWDVISLRDGAAASA
jgi:HAD superfamily hydrolase (TIGR01490 family)